MPTTRREILAAAVAAGVLGGTLPAESWAREPPAPAKKLRILILGGTGFTGPHQVRYALERGHDVTLFNRGKRPTPEWARKVEQLYGDRDTGDLSALAGRQWDACIDNPTSLPSWVRDARAALGDRVGQYVFISTISVFADTSKPGMDESAPLAQYIGKDAMAETRATLGANMSLYGPLKALSEREALNRFAGRATVIRPGLIVGPGDETDRFTYWPVRLARGGDVLAPGDGTDPVQFIDARDLAEWTIRMVEQRRFGTYNATGPARELSMRKMLHGIRKATKADARLHWAPAELLERFKVQPWSDMPVWVPGTGDSAGFGRISVARAVAAGLTYRPLKTTAVDTLAWFNAQPAERRAKLRAGIDPAREREVLDALMRS